MFCSVSCYYTMGEVVAGTILCMHPANERRRYNVTSSHIGCAHAQNGWRSSCCFPDKSVWCPFGKSTSYILKILDKIMNVTVLPKYTPISLKFRPPVPWCVPSSAAYSLNWTMPLTYWGRDKMAAFSQTTFSNAFTSMKMFEFRLQFHWSLFLRVQLTIFQHWFR